MNLKKLDQSVFEGLPSEYRWAVVRNCGSANAFNSEPKFFKADFRDWDFNNVDTVSLGKGYDATDWQNSMIERQDVPTAADIDWIKGAAYWCKPIPPIQPSGFFINADFTQVHDGVSWVQALPQVKDLQDGTHSKHVVKRPESIRDVARSIEAARVAEKSGNRCATCTANICSVIDDCYVQRAQEESARIEEQSERTYPHYFKDVSGVDAIDLYHVARLYDITDPALFHAFKKIACAGKRGAKDQAQDVQEAIDALKRWQELNV